MPKYHKASGNIMANGFKDNAKKPDFTGTIELGREQLKAMVNIAKSNAQANVPLKVALWDRTGKESGNPYKYCTLEVTESDGESDTGSDSSSESAPNVESVSDDPELTKDIPF